MPEERAGPALSLAEQKRRLRAEILARRDGIPADQRAALNQRITAKLLSLPEYQVAGVVAAYMSIGSEVDTGALIRDVLGRGKMLVLPRVDRERKRLVLYGVADPERDLLAGTWGIKEPDPARCREVSWQQVEWALVPGLAFDCA